MSIDIIILYISNIITLVLFVFYARYNYIARLNLYAKIITIEKLVISYDKEILLIFNNTIENLKISKTNKETVEDIQKVYGHYINEFKKFMDLMEEFKKPNKYNKFLN